MASKVVSIRMDEELYDTLSEWANAEHRSLSNMILSILLTEKENVYTFIDVSKLIRELSTYPDRVGISKDALMRICDKVNGGKVRDKNE